MSAYVPQVITAQDKVRILGGWQRLGSMPVRRSGLTLPTLHAISHQYLAKLQPVA